MQMTIQQAIDAVRQVGSLAVVGGAIRYEIRSRRPQVAEALATLRAHRPEALAVLSGPTKQTESEALERVLKGRAVELWSDSAGRLFLVTDEEDARLVMERFGAGRGEIYTVAEAQRIVGVNDPAMVAEIHEWKRRFEGAVRETRKNTPGSGVRQENAELVGTDTVETDRTHPMVDSDVHRAHHQREFCLRLPSNQRSRRPD
jgi:hypothetical protein